MEYIEEYEIKNTNVANFGADSRLHPKTFAISCEEVTVSINSLKLKLDFDAEQLKQFDAIEINGIVFQRVGE